jgi:hypothetical protein
MDSKKVDIISNYLKDYPFCDNCDFFENVVRIFTSILTIIDREGLSDIITYDLMDDYFQQIFTKYFLNKNILIPDVGRFRNVLFELLKILKNNEAEKNFYKDKFFSKKKSS